MKTIYTLYWRKSTRHAWNLIGRARDLEDVNRQAFYMRRDDPTGLIAYSDDIYKNNYAPAILPSNHKGLTEV